MEKELEVTPGQIRNIIEQIEKKEISRERLQAIINSGFLSDVFDIEDPSKINRQEVKKLFGLSAYQSFMVHIGNRSVKELLEAGKYDGYVNSNITDANFPDDTTGDKEVFLFPISDILDTDDVIAKMDKENFKPASVKTGLAFGEQYPDFQRRNPLIALGSVWVAPFGARRVLGLWGRGSARDADLDWCGHQWHPRYIFLAVSK